MTDVKPKMHNESIMEMQDKSYKGTEETERVITSSEIEGLIRVRIFTIREYINMLDPKG